MKPQIPPFLSRFYLDILCIVGSGFALAFYFIYSTTSDIESLRFAIISLLVLCFYLWQINDAWERCDDAEQKRLITSGLGPATRITLLRGTMLACLSGTLGLNQLTEPVTVIMPITFLVAILLDAADGVIARRTGSQSLFGGVVDTLTDGLAMAIGALVGVANQFLPPEFIAVGAAYYIYIAGVRIREKAQMPLYALYPGTLRRTMAGFLMGFVAVALFGLYSLKAVTIPARIYMLFFLIGFIFDWLTVSGRLDLSGNGFARARTILYRSIFYTLPLVLRVFLLFVIVVEFKGHNQYVPFLVLAGGVALGVIARTVAVVLMLLLGWQITMGHTGHYAQLALAYSSTIALLGAGASALWEPEEKWLNR